MQMSTNEAATRKSDAPDAAVLRIRSGPRAGSWFEFNRRRVSLGRSESCDIVLDHLSVAEEHAVVERAEGGHVLSDNGTLTGTFLNQEPVHGAESLREGDEVRIGVYRLTFHAPRPQRPAVATNGAPEPKE